MSKKRPFLAAILSIIFVGAGLAIAAPAQAVDIRVDGCTVHSNNPHPSVHYNGTIDGVGTISCPTRASNLYLKVTLEKYNGASWTRPALDYLNSFGFKSTAASSCSAGPGTFRTRVDYVVKRYSTSTPKAGNLYTPWMGVACGPASRIAG